MEEKVKHPILLVDDEPEILNSLKSLLRREFELHTAESAREALEIMSRYPIHVVMTDQRMPEMTGIELVGRVKSQFPEAVRIVFTGYADIKAVIEAINEGGLFRYITKPWDPDELIQVLHDAAGEYDRMVERRRLSSDVREYVAQSLSCIREATKGLDHASPLRAQVAQIEATAGELVQRLQKDR